jgi:hypothetical protein
VVKSKWTKFPAILQEWEDEIEPTTKQLAKAKLDPTYQVGDENLEGHEEENQQVRIKSRWIFLFSLFLII